MRSFGCLGSSSARARPFQAISLHYYTRTGPWNDKGEATRFTTDQWYLALARASYIEELLTRHGTVMDRYDPHRKVGLVLDEWGTYPAGPHPQVHGGPGAVGGADEIGVPGVLHGVAAAAVDEQRVVRGADERPVIARERATETQWPRSVPPSAITSTSAQ
jgi:hypothetical protein